MKKGVIFIVTIRLIVSAEYLFRWTELKLGVWQDLSLQWYSSNLSATGLCLCIW